MKDWIKEIGIFLVGGSVFAGVVYAVLIEAFSLGLGFVLIVSDDPPLILQSPRSSTRCAVARMWAQQHPAHASTAIFACLNEMSKTEGCVLDRVIEGIK